VLLKGQGDVLSAQKIAHTRTPQTRLVMGAFDHGFGLVNFQTLLSRSWLPNQPCLWRLPAISNGNLYVLASSNNAFGKGGTVPDEEIELLRSVLAHAYEQRQPFLMRLARAVKDCVGPRTPRKPVTGSLNIMEKKKDAA